jgi:UDP-N-acetylmuramate--alanine ligase
MSGYARAAHALGATVTGSDRAETPYLARLREEGVLDAAIGHDAGNVPAGEEVELVYSSAIPVDNPERAVARERGLPDRARAELLGELSGLRRTIAVAGAHGKTTTAAMIVHVLRGEGLDPGWLIGSSIGGGLANSHWSEGEWLVVEADESDRSMLSLHAEIAVLTNVELDHHASFRSLAELRAAFAQFLALARGAVVVWDRPELTSLSAPGPGVELVRFDTPGLALLAGGSRFDWRGQEVWLGVPGEHNALDAAGALEAARLAGADPVRSIDRLRDFRGAGRRFQRVGVSARGAQVYEDYAHHPTEVAATLQGARTLPHERLVAVFQPHLFSRTAMLANEFGRALALADVVAVLDVYPARERAADYPGVSGLTIVRATVERAHGRTVLWLPGFASARPVLEGLLGAGDVCVAMGAGDIDVLVRELVA